MTTLHSAPDWLLSPLARAAPTSGLVEVINHGRDREGLMPLWIGEGDLPTPDFIREAAIRSITEGETFYTWQRGIPPLREAIAAYMTGLYDRPFDASQFFVTVGGMHALQLALRLVAGPGDEVILPTPAWPNFNGSILVNGSVTRPVPFVLAGDEFALDIRAISAAVGPRTRAICINSPSNPTGWTATRADLEQVLELARRHRLWIIADEIYGRFFCEGERAPSFHDIMERDDRVLFVQTCSKNWAMTGWRIGWLEAPVALGQTVEDLIQLSTSGVAVPVQRAAIAALTEGEDFVRFQIARAAENRSFLIEALTRHNGLTVPRPGGAFYLFVGIEGMPDSRTAALRLIDEAGIGLVPGDTFGPGGEGFMRLCYMRDPAQIRDAAGRITAALPRLRALAGA